MNLSFLIRPPGCCLAPVMIPLILPVLLVILSFKVIASVLRDENVSSNRKSVPFSPPWSEKTRQTQTNTFAGLRLTRDSAPTRNSKRHAEGLFLEITEALENNQRISIDKRGLVREQARQMTEHVLASFEKITRIRRRRTIVNRDRQIELEQLERRLSGEIFRSLDKLEDALVSIIQVDVLGGNAKIDRLLSDLDDSNARLRDIADAHEELRTVREAWAGKIE